tara:strand:- start:7 stop:312 length:306 start_codon:yes stop_codon:yes gene_type:complete
MITYSQAIKSINPNAQFSYSGDEGSSDTLNNIEWFNTTPINKSDIIKKHEELLSNYENNKYQRDRKKEYPSIADQLDDIYHNGIDGWKQTIKAVKDKYPKE